MPKSVLAMLLAALVAACADPMTKDEGSAADVAPDTGTTDVVLSTDAAADLTTSDTVSLPQGCTADSDCSTGLTCIVGSCDSGACRLQPAPATTQCDDGDACSTADHCHGGACKGTLTSCDDGNPCTTDGCLAASGCTHVSNAAKCDDGNACTVADACAAATCQGGQVLDCDDGNPCTQDSCHLTQGCKHTATPGVSCNDGDACTVKDACVANVCTGKPLNCDDENDCTSDSCAGGVCGHEDQAGPCSDGDACTTGDKCASGACVGTALACDDGNICTTDFCGGGKCQAGVAPFGAACDDGDPCTYTKCHGGACVASQKYWSQTFSSTELKGLIPQEDGVVVFGLKGGFGWIGWYSNSGSLVKEEALPPVHVAATASGALLVVTPNGVSRRTAKGEAVWTLEPESFSDAMGTGKPELNFVAASGELVTVFGSVTTGKYRRAFVARYSGDGKLQWQKATPPEKGATFLLRTATSTGHVVAQTLTSFAPIGAPSVFWYSWSPQGQLNLESSVSLSASVITPTQDGNLFIAGSSVRIYTPMLTAVSAPVVVTSGSGLWAAQDADGFTLMKGGKLHRFDGQGNLHGLAAQLPALTAVVSDGEGLYAYRVVNGQNETTKDSLFFRLDRFGHGSCNVCDSQANQSCSDDNPCSLDDCDTVGGCTATPHGCDDGLPCTLDSCAPLTGCAHQAITSGPCDDGNPCTIDGNCTAAGCSVVGEKCDDGDLCTYETCSVNTGNCTSTPLGAGALCGDAGRCSAEGECLTKFCEVSMSFEGPYAVAAGSPVEVPFEVTSASELLWARFDADGNGNAVSLWVQFNDEALSSSGAYKASTGTYWTQNYPTLKPSSGSVKTGIANLNPTGTWKLRMQPQSPTALPFGNVESIKVTFGYNCPP